MSGSKRSCPFGYVKSGGSPRQAKALREDTASICEATLHLGAHSKAGKQHHGWGRVSSDPSDAMERLTLHNRLTTSKVVGGPRPCYVCTSRSSDKVCFHCSRGSCEQCSKRCAGCQELFCSVCCISDYGDRLERSFCFDCNAETLTLNRPDCHSSAPVRSSMDLL